MQTQVQKADSDVIYDIWLSVCAGVGNVRAKMLIDRFGTSEKIYRAGRNELLEVDGIGFEAVDGLMNKDLSAAEKTLVRCRQIGCTVLAVSDENYPDRLRNIYDPPTVIYVSGSLPYIDNIPVVGIVGTRECTPYGYKNAEKLGRMLSQNGIAVTTGLAKGIDTAAANGALGGDMPVIGVIGSGVDIVFPAQNRALFGKVTAKGAIVSEYPPGTMGLPAHFPQRNRIISGLSCGVAVIEAPQRSGALITAHRALEQNRDVFVLPGNVDLKTCVGSNNLLRIGAIPFLSAGDIIDEYKDLFTGVQKPIDNTAAEGYIDLSKLTEKLSVTEQAIICCIVSGPLYADEIIASTKIPAGAALSSLTSLELEGLVRRDNYGKWEISA